MTNSTTPANGEPEKRQAPVKLTRRHDEAMDRMETRALPDDVSRLDVSAFNSAI
jgi:hypothetical protein